MTQSSPLIVRIERSGTAFGAIMNEIRSWLDSHKIQPADFRPSESGPGDVAFEIRFLREDEAHLFEQAFTLIPVGI
jgi:hypothetical protein